MGDPGEIRYAGSCAGPVCGPSTRCGPTEIGLMSEIIPIKHASLFRDDQGVFLRLPDKSVVVLDKHTLRFLSVQEADIASPAMSSEAAPATPITFSKIDHRSINFDKLAETLQNPHLRFGECFKRVSDIPRYSPKRSIHNFDVKFLTRLYDFPGSYQGGTFSSSETQWRFLDGGIISHNGYGWGSHSWTVVEGAEALRAVCMFFGIKQPQTTRREPPRRPLSVLLEEMTKDVALKKR